MPSSKRWIVAMLVLLGAGPCRADDAALDAGDGNLAQARSALAGVPPPGPAGFTRTELPLDPGRSLPGFRSEASEVGVRWWTASGRAGLGLGVSSIGYALQPLGPLRPAGAHLPGAAGDAPGAAWVGTGTVLTLGLRYRTSERSTLYADAAGVHGLGLHRDAVVGKVGIEFKAAQSRFNIAYGGLGLQLAGDTRMSVRVRKGGLAFYMRSAF